jgi:hypothetical protein
MGFLIFTVGVLPKLFETLTESETDPDLVGVQPFIVGFAGVQPVSVAATAASSAVVATMVASLRTLDSNLPDLYKSASSVP